MIFSNNKTNNCFSCIQVVSTHRSLYSVVSLQIVNRATSVVSLISRLWTNVNAAVNNDLGVIEDFVNGLNDVYTGSLAFNIDILSIQLTDVIEAISKFILIASRVNATCKAPSDEEFGRISQLQVSQQLYTE